MFSIFRKKRAFKIAHIGSYGINLGDNAALWNARKAMDKYGVIEWSSIEIAEFHGIKNEPRKCLERFREISAGHDAIVFGGGGLIEGSFYNKYGSGYKLPLTEAILDKIRKPVVIFAVGYNRFRGEEEIGPQGLENLKVLIERSTVFSVRNDGSEGHLEAVLGGKNPRIKVAPDPGLVCSFQLGRKASLDRVALQLAWNRSLKVMMGRFGSEENIHAFSARMGERDYLLLPHSEKDYALEALNARSLVARDQFKEWCSFSRTEDLMRHLYGRVDLVLAMRGHGQMLALALNVPSISVSTQDKVGDFALQHGLGAYLVDAKEPDWLEQLDEKIDRMKRPEYLGAWYEARDGLVARFQNELDGLAKETASAIRL